MDERIAGACSLYARDLQLQRLGDQWRRPHDRAESTGPRNSTLSRQCESVCLHGAIPIRPGEPGGECIPMSRVSGLITEERGVIDVNAICGDLIAAQFKDVGE